MGWGGAGLRIGGGEGEGQWLPVFKPYHLKRFMLYIKNYSEI